MPSNFFKIVLDTKIDIDKIHTETKVLPNVLSEERGKTNLECPTTSIK
jgi:hypothetical protein